MDRWRAVRSLSIFRKAQDIIQPSLEGNSKARDLKNTAPGGSFQKGKNGGGSPPGVAF